MARSSILSLTALLLASVCAVDASSPDDLTATASESLDKTDFFAPPPNPAAVKQVVDLIRARKLSDAVHVATLATTPQAVWFSSGTPSEVAKAVEKTMAEAERARKVPTLVAYNVPFRDCAQYSAGGAVDGAAYEAWILGFARGIGKGKAVVILEPDSLGIIPYSTTIYGQADWCQPTVTDSTGNTVPAPGATSADRYALLNNAVDSLAKVAPGAAVYLDGTHSAWLGVGEAASRLVRAGVQRAQGFYLNVSNYQTTDQSNQFGTWVSTCIAAATAGPAWMLDPTTGGPHFDYCPSQYNPATGFALDYSDAYRATVTAGLQGLLGDAVAATHFVVDTGRNGHGAWTPTATYPDPQVWCNAPGSGAGLRPTSSTGVALADAYLWLKTPGESDGSCNRGIAGSTTDPEWGGIVDPAAGAWFPEQALQLSKLADPKLF
jgi:endoglucanase